MHPHALYHHTSYIWRMRHIFQSVKKNNPSRSWMIEYMKPHPSYDWRVHHCSLSCYVVCWMNVRCLAVAYPSNTSWMSKEISNIIQHDGDFRYACHRFDLTHSLFLNMYFIKGYQVHLHASLQSIGLWFQSIDARLCLKAGIYTGCRAWTRCKPMSAIR